MSLETLAPYLAGPGAGLLICILVGLGLYKFAVGKIFPLIEGAINRHLSQVDEMNKRHEDQHNKIIARCEQGFEKVNTDLTKIQSSVDNLAAIKEAAK